MRSAQPANLAAASPAAGPPWWRRPWPVFLGLAAVSIVAWEAVAADLTFVGDDWGVFSERSLTPSSLLMPYNEHLSAVPIALLALLKDSIGIRWHAVYLVPVLLANAMAAAGLLLVAARHRPAWVALLLATAVLFLGAGWDDLLLVWQVGATLSVAAGVWALACLDAAPSRPVPAALLCAVAIASSSFGLPFAVAVASLAALKRDAKGLALLVLVGVAYLSWYSAFHREGAGVCGTPSIGGLVVSALPFAAGSLVYAVGAPLGLGQAVQPLIGVAAGVLVLWLAIVWSGRRMGGQQLVLAALAGIVAMGVLVAYGRGCLGVQAVGSSRYAYCTGVLALLGFSGTRLAGLGGQLIAGHPLAARIVALAAVVALQATSITSGHAVLLENSNAVRAAVGIIIRDTTGQCHTSTAMTDSTTAAVASLPGADRLRSLVPNTSDLDAPPWLSAGPSRELTQQLRHVMCDLPPVAP